MGADRAHGQGEKIAIIIGIGLIMTTMTMWDRP